MNELVVFGSGGHAKVLIEAARAAAPDRPLILVDDDPEAVGRQVLGVAVAGSREWLRANLPGAPVALGVGNNRARADLLQWLREHGHPPFPLIHPAAVVGSTVQVGAGAFVAAGAVLIADACIGAGAIVNTAASVDHDCVVGDAAHLGPGVRLCGNVCVGERSLLGVGTVVRPGVRIGADVTVGAGSAVVRDLPAGGLFAGCPARPLPTAGSR